jgi:hypothetical protein
MYLISGSILSMGTTVTLVDGLDVLVGDIKFRFSRLSVQTAPLCLHSHA